MFPSTASYNGFSGPEVGGAKRCMGLANWWLFPKGRRDRSSWSGGWGAGGWGNIPKGKGSPCIELVAARKALARWGGIEAGFSPGIVGGPCGRSVPSSQTSPEAAGVILPSPGEWLWRDSERGDDWSLVIEDFVVLELFIGPGAKLGCGFPTADLIVAISAALRLRHFVRRFWNHT